MSLINDENIEPKVTQVKLLGGHHAIARDKYTTLAPQRLHLLFSIRLLFVIELHDVVDSKAPLFELGLPVHLHGSWHHDKNLLDLIRIEETLEQRGNLNSFAQAHIVTKNPALFRLVEAVEPFHTYALVLKEVLVDRRRQSKPVWEKVLSGIAPVLEPISWLARCKLEIKSRIIVGVLPIL